MTLKRKLIWLHLKAKYNEVYPIIFMFWAIFSLTGLAIFYSFFCAVYPKLLIFSPFVILFVFSGVITIRDFDFKTTMRAKYEVRNVDFYDEYDNAVIKIRNLKKQIKIF